MTVYCTNYSIQFCTADNHSKKQRHAKTKNHRYATKNSTDGKVDALYLCSAFLVFLTTQSAFTLDLHSPFTHIH